MASLYATKASNLAICAFVLPDDKKAQNKTYRIEKSSKQNVSKSCGFSPGTPVFTHKES